MCKRRNVRLYGYLIFKGGVVFGCAMEKIQGKYKPIIKSANNLKDLQPLLGSKYVQADTQNTYYETQKLLKKVFKYYILVHHAK